MSHTTWQLALLARETLQDRLARDERGEWRFARVETAARPHRIAALRNTGITTNEIRTQFPELSPIDIKAARITSFLTTEDILEHSELLERPEYAVLLGRLHELAALVHAGRDCCKDEPLPRD